MTLEDYKDRCPHGLFDEWFAAAAGHEGQDVNAMTLATLDETGMPQARTVLLKAHDHSEGEGEFVFYTNNESRKGRALLAHPRAALLFFWRVQRRQVLIEGEVRQMSSEESAPYYHSRPRESRLGAWASAQSRPIESLQALHRQVEEQTEKYEGQDPPIPPYWRGFRLRPTRIEFWQEGAFRVHQRLVFTFTAGGWQSGLLQP